jgi:hypothetical protein
MGNWWRCKVVKSSFLFSEQAIIYAKNGDAFITLFDGKKEARISKNDLPYIKLLFRLDNQESDLIEEDYREKIEARDLQRLKDLEA